MTVYKCALTKKRGRLLDALESHLSESASSPPFPSGCEPFPKIRDHVGKRRDRLRLDHRAAFAISERIPPVYRIDKLNVARCDAVASDKFRIDPVVDRNIPERPVRHIVIQPARRDGASWSFLRRSECFHSPCSGTDARKAASGVRRACTAFWSPESRLRS